jgi:hypothetical protein
VSLLITRDFLYWGSDNPIDGASVFRFQVASGHLEEVLHIGKVVYHSTMRSDGTMVISTTYEPKSKYVQENSPPNGTDL